MKHIIILALLLFSISAYSQEQPPANGCFQTGAERAAILTAAVAGEPYTESTWTIAPDMNSSGVPGWEPSAFMTLMQYCISDWLDLTPEEVADPGTYATVLIENPINGGGATWRFPANANIHGDRIGAATDPCQGNYYYACNFVAPNQVEFAGPIIGM